MEEQQQALAERVVVGSKVRVRGSDLSLEIIAQTETGWIAGRPLNNLVGYGSRHPRHITIHDIREVL